MYRARENEPAPRCHMRTMHAAPRCQQRASCMLRCAATVHHKGVAGRSHPSMLWLGASKAHRPRQASSGQMVLINIKYMLIVPRNLILRVVGKSGVHIAAHSLQHSSRDSAVGSRAGAQQGWRNGRGRCGVASDIHSTGR